VCIRSVSRFPFPCGRGMRPSFLPQLATSFFRADDPRVLCREEADCDVVARLCDPGMEADGFGRAAVHVPHPVPVAVKSRGRGTSTLKRLKGPKRTLASAPRALRGAIYSRRPSEGVRVSKRVFECSTFWIAFPPTNTTCWVVCLVIQRYILTASGRENDRRANRRNDGR
jgi:hypothetical protein